MQDAHRLASQTIASVSWRSVTMSEMAVLPPGLSIRAISRNTAGLSSQRLMTPLLMTTSADLSATGACHVLALRVFPDNDFGPYRTVWHRDPSGRWSIHLDGPRLDTACPRYYGAACGFTGHTQIGLTWAAPATLHVSMNSPALEWTLTATSTRLPGVLNMISAALPLVTWRLRPLVRARERALPPPAGRRRRQGRRSAVTR